MFSYRSGDRDILEQQVTPRVYDEAPQAGPSGEPGSAHAEEPGDFSASGSDDWAPSGAEQESSEDDDDEEVYLQNREIFISILNAYP